MAASRSVREAVDPCLAVRTLDGWLTVPALVERLRSLSAELNNGDDGEALYAARRLVADARALGLLGELDPGEPDYGELQALRAAAAAPGVEGRDFERLPPALLAVVPCPLCGGETHRVEAHGERWRECTHGCGKLPDAK